MNGIHGGSSEDDGSRQIKKLFVPLEVLKQE
jgi:hypothetical protein